MGFITRVKKFFRVSSTGSDDPKGQTSTPTVSTTDTSQQSVPAPTFTHAPTQSFPTGTSGGGGGGGSSGGGTVSVAPQSTPSGTVLVDVSTGDPVASTSPAQFPSSTPSGSTTTPSQTNSLSAPLIVGGQQRGIVTETGQFFPTSRPGFVPAGFRGGGSISDLQVDEDTGRTSFRIVENRSRGSLADVGLGGTRDFGDPSKQTRKPSQKVKVSDLAIEGSFLGGTTEERKTKFFQERFFKPEFDAEVSKLQSKISDDPQAFIKKEGLDVMSREDIQLDKSTGELTLTSKFLKPQITKAEKRARQKFKNIKFEESVLGNIASDTRAIEKIGLGLTEDFITGVLQRSKGDPLSLTIGTATTKGKPIPSSFKKPIPSSFKFSETSGAGKILSTPTLDPSKKFGIGTQAITLGGLTIASFGSGKTSLVKLGKDKQVLKTINQVAKGEVGAIELERLVKLRTGASGRTLLAGQGVQRQLALDNRALVKSSKIPGRQEVIIGETSFAGIGGDFTKDISKTFSPTELQSLGLSTKSSGTGLFKESQLSRTPVRIKHKTSQPITEFSGQFGDIVKTKNVDFEKLAPIKDSGLGLFQDRDLSFLNVAFDSGSKGKSIGIGLRFRETKKGLVDRSPTFRKVDGEFSETLIGMPRRRITTKKGGFIKEDFAPFTIVERQRTKGKITSQKPLTEKGDLIFRETKLDTQIIPQKSERFALDDLVKEFQKKPSKKKIKPTRTQIGSELIKKFPERATLEFDEVAGIGGRVSSTDLRKKVIFSRTGTLKTSKPKKIADKVDVVKTNADDITGSIGDLNLDKARKVNRKKGILELFSEQQQIPTFNPGVISSKSAIKGARTRTVVPKTNNRISTTSRTLFAGIPASQFQGTGQFERTVGGTLPSKTLQTTVASGRTLPIVKTTPRNTITPIFREIQNNRFSGRQPTSIISDTRTKQQEKLAQAQIPRITAKSRQKQIQTEISDINLNVRGRGGRNSFPDRVVGIGLFIPKGIKGGNILSRRIPKTRGGRRVPRSPTLDALGLNIRGTGLARGETIGAGSLVTRPILNGISKKKKKKKNKK
jgi:hypothetical protein